MNLRRVYITKHALTRGIFEADVEGPDLTICPHMVWTEPDDIGLRTFYHKDEWHETRREAVSKANAMRALAVKSARNKLDRLEKMVFELTAEDREVA